MKVKLVSYSTPTEEFLNEGIDNAQELVAFCARVSNPSNQLNTETSEKLIKYLIKNAHWSPLEMVSACLEIETTRDIARQILRHRSFSFQEFSQRYADASFLGETINVPDLRTQDPKNRQNSIDNLNEYKDTIYKSQIRELFAKSKHLYDLMIKDGVAKECAREVLPLSTPTKLYMNGTLRSWIHYTDLRCSNGTQLEHKVIADECRKHIESCFPLVSKALSSM